MSAIGGESAGGHRARFARRIAWALMTSGERYRGPAAAYRERPSGGWQEQEAG
jgi:hypothetical protein